MAPIAMGRHGGVDLLVVASEHDSHGVPGLRVIAKMAGLLHRIRAALPGTFGQRRSAGGQVPPLL